MMKKGGGKYGDQVRNTTQYTLCCIAYSASGLATCSELRETGARDSPRSLQITRGSLSRAPRSLRQHKSYHGGTKGRWQGVTTGTSAALHQRTGRAATPAPITAPAPGAWGGRWEPSLSGCLGKGVTARQRALPRYPTSLRGPAPARPPRPLRPADVEPARNRKRKYALAAPRREAQAARKTPRGNHGNGPSRADPQRAGWGWTLHPPKRNALALNFPQTSFSSSHGVAVLRLPRSARFCTL